MTPFAALDHKIIVKLVTNRDIATKIVYFYAEDLLYRVINVCDFQVKVATFLLAEHFIIFTI